MEKIKLKNTGKFFTWLFVFLVIVFLGNRLLLDWSKIKEYNYSFDISFLILSVFLFGLSILLSGFIWKKIIDFLDDGNEISSFKAIQYSLYARFGKYVPGKIWTIAGLVYLGKNHNVSKRVLFAASIQQMLLGILSGLMLGLFILFVAFKDNFEIIFFLCFLIFSLVLFFLRPKWFYPVSNKILSFIGKSGLDDSHFLKRKYLILVFLYSVLVHLLIGSGFYFLVASIVNIGFDNFVFIAFSFIIAGVMGIVAFFSPGGLGIKEGVIVFLLQNIFPVSIAIMISVIARLWVISIELTTLSVFELVKYINKKYE